MVFLAKWIRENMDDSRLLLVTDRTELDEQIEKVFKGVNEEIYRSKSGADLIEKLNSTKPWLLCSLIHKFGGKNQNEDEDDITAGRDYIKELKAALPLDFVPKGNLIVFVDECHRTQSGDLHNAMKTILPNAIFVGFTGTPLLKADKQKSIEVFGQYIHTYRFDEAVKDKVVLDLRYEARDIDQRISSPEKIDQWFEANTSGLTTFAKAQLRERWGKMQTLLSSRSRLEQIVADIQLDMETKDRLKSGYGNAMLVSSSIYQACKYYELFQGTPLKGKCAIVTSYQPNPTDIKGEETGEGITERLHQYDIYKKMLNGKDTETFEKEAKKKFIDEPGQMKLLIVVDKLLTGFDAPSATYLYIDKQMRDHRLFQAICRVNRVAGETKSTVTLLTTRTCSRPWNPRFRTTLPEPSPVMKRKMSPAPQESASSCSGGLEQALEEVQLLCEPVDTPKDTAAYLRYFVAVQSGISTEIQANEGKRITCTSSPPS
jgi:type I restriction enzyme R subunit